MKKLNLVLVMLVVLVCVAAAHAQSGLGEITGFVYDDDGKGVEKVILTIESDSLLRGRKLYSGNKGYYRIINLPPGNYKLTFAKTNYQTQEITGVSVRAGKTSSFNVTLEVGEFAETLVIVHEAPIIDLKNPERQINIDGDFLGRLPLSTTREWTSALSLVPSVVMDGEFVAAGLSESFASVSFHGAGGTENIINMDNASIQTETRSDPVLFTSAIIEDIEVVTSGYDASIRSGLGGYINVVTKSGGNDLSGTFQLVMQPEAWNWDNTEDDSTPKSVLYLPEASLGGPIMRDRIWFFASALYDYRDRGIYRDENALHWLTNNGYSPADYAAVDERRSGRFFGKITTALTENDKITATLNWDRTENLVGNRIQLDSARYLRKTGGPTFILNYSKYFSEDLFLTLQGAYRESETGQFPESGNLDDVGTSIYRFGEVYSYGPYLAAGGVPDTYTVAGGMGSAYSRLEKHTEFKGDVNLFMENLWGQHDTRFGVYYLPERKYKVTFHYAQPFHRLDQALNENGEWVTFKAIHFESDLPGDEYVNANAAGYFQDSWTLNSRLTLNMGLRIEQNFAEVDVFKGAGVSPNIGFSYALKEDLSQGLRFSYARKYEVLSNYDDLVATYNSSVTSGAIYYYDYTLDGVWDRIRNYPVNPVTVNNPGNLTSEETGGTVLLDDNLSPSHADYFQVGYTAVLPWKLTFDAAFLYNIFSNDFRKYSDYNFLYENGEPVALRDPSTPYMDYWTNNKWSSTHYRGLEFSLSRTFQDGWQMMASYAWQSTTEKGEWSPYEAEHYYFPESWFEYSDVRNEPKHVFRLAASYVGPYDIMFNGNIVHRSSLPNYAYQYAFGNGIDVPEEIELSGHSIYHPFMTMPNWAQPRSDERKGFIDGATVVNLGIGKIFEISGYSLETQLQIFNIFNDSTLISGAAYYVDDNFEFISPSYYDIQAPRTAQLLVKLSF